MKIKTKLIANVLLTAAIVFALSLASFFSIKYLSERLSYLTDKSTPFQIRTMELQAELQLAVSSLLQVNSAKNINEYKIFRDKAEKNLSRLSATQMLLEKQHGSTPALSGELARLAQELFNSVEARINSGNSAVDANKKASELMQRSSASLKILDASIVKLQAGRSNAFTKALENTTISSARLRSIEILRDQLQALEHLAQNLQDLQKSRSLLPIKGKLNTIAAAVLKNDYLKANQALAAQYSEVIDKLKEQTAILALAQQDKNSPANKRVSETLEVLSSRLITIMLQLDQETVLASNQLEAESARQKDIFRQSNSANRILVANSELVASGANLMSDINQLLVIDSTRDLDLLDREIGLQFNRIQERIKEIETSLLFLQAPTELQLLRTAAMALASTRKGVFGTDGIIATLKTKLTAMEQSELTAAKLNAMVAKQTEKGREISGSAKIEQAKAVLTVNRVIKRSLAQIAGIGVAAIVIGVLFGLWIYRSVLPPLKLALGAVRSQQVKGQEKALLAEAVSKGELNLEVTISEPMELDERLLAKDEMGMLLGAVAGMSQAQTTLDTALAEMTVSLRKSREEEIRRDRLKTGLHELNRILREEHSTLELLDYSLAFMTAYLDAGVAIIYLYNEREKLLEKVAGYAVSVADGAENLSFRIAEGLVGQVASDLKTIHLHTVPAGYMTIASALGEADPVEIAILPVVHNNILAGVMEIGSFRPFSDEDLDFLQQGLEGVAIAILNNRSRELVTELLEQTQTQSEELRTQQEELQQTNEELEERARMLESRVRFS